LFLSREFFVFGEKIREEGKQRWRLIRESPRLQCRGAHFSGIPVKGQKAFGQKRFGIL
jgi:hypothetical protein